MIDYQKIAYICFRVAGMIIFIVGILMTLSAIIVASPAISVFSILKVYMPLFIRRFACLYFKQFLSKIGLFNFK